MPFKMNTIIVVNGCGIIHIAYRVHALSIVIKMLATPRQSWPPHRPPPQLHLNGS